jgi:DNA (cytosine-5)-methyltransferase 1
MRYGSVCSGIEAASCAWHPLGWRASFLAEIEPFPRAVLKHHYPETPLHGDFTTVQAGEYDPIDLLVGGTPCQSFSVAGLRGGLDDERGNLALEYLRLADRLRPRWLVWENVPGVLSSNGGRDFGAILGGMVELGYGFAYRVLDAQFFGVAQRRRRVFVVGHLGDWRRAAAVLFERHSLQGHPAPSREKGESSAGTIGASVGDCSRDNIGESVIASSGDVAATLGAKKSGGWRGDLDNETYVTPILDGAKGRTDNRGSRDGSALGEPGDPMFTLREGSAHAVAYGLRSDAHRTGEARTPSADAEGRVRLRDDGFNPLEECAPTLDAGAPHAVAFALRGREGGAMPEVGGDQIGALRSASGGSSRDYVAYDTTQVTSAANRSNPQPGDPCHPLAAGAHAPAIAGSAVRRLTPRECERLQGFPEIENTLRILVCRNEDEKRARASFAAGSSHLHLPEQSAPVAVRVLIDLERQVLRLHSLGRSPWSATIAELASSSRLPMQSDAFARLAALTNDAVAISTRAGRAASPASTPPSSEALNGSVSVVLSGREIDALAGDAERFTAALSQCSRSITSQHGLHDPICASTWETLACCVAHAMTGFIPAAMRDACSYEIRLTAHQGYTHIPWRNGMAPDGPRYKALGNSMAVPVMAWIGRRIEAVEALIAAEARAA